MRKPVGIALREGSGALVVCDDGSVWCGVEVGQFRDAAWAEAPPIPDTERAVQIQTAKMLEVDDEG